MFFHKADYEGLVYYVQNWETPFEVYKRNMERPFFQALMRAEITLLTEEELSELGG